MPKGQLHLLRTRRFLPLFISQFVGAANDNVFKSALVILITYRLAGASSIESPILVAITEALLLLPFFLFSASAGQLADKFEKSRMIRLIKLADIVVMMFGAAAFFAASPYFLLGTLFLAATGSAFFGPLKYGILPDLLRDEELIAANGLIEAATNVAILLGLVTGGLLILRDFGAFLVSAVVVVLALVGWISSLFIPLTVPAAPELQINPNFIAETWRIVRYTARQRSVYLSILGICWFWAAGAIFVSQFPGFAKDTLHADEEVVTLFLTAFTIGAALGALWCNRLLNGEVSPKYVPFGALGVALFTFDLFLASQSNFPASPTLLDALEFLSLPAPWRITADLILLSVCAGLYVVPLYAIIQSRSEPAHRARVVACNNIMNALAVVLAVTITIVMVKLGFDVPHVFLAVAIMGAGVAFYICGLLPGTVLKMAGFRVLRVLFGVKVKGLEHYKAAGDRAVVVANHVSFLDGGLLAAVLPGSPVFAIEAELARKWWVKPFLKLVETYPVAPTKPFATKGLIRTIQQGRVCVIFPEGRITITGALMKIYEGPGLIADKAQVPIVPVRIDGPQYTPFSRLRGKVRLRWFPRISVTILPPQTLTAPAGLKGRHRRQWFGSRLYDLMSEMIFETCDRRQTLYRALLDARAVHGGSMTVVDDVLRRSMSYDRLVAGSLILGRRLAALTTRGENVGVLLANSTAAAVAFFALQAFGRVPAMLNFSTGTANMVSACNTAEIRIVVTAHQFVEVARFQEIVSQLARVARIVYLEDLLNSTTVFDRLVGLAAPMLAAAIHRRRRRRPDDPAAVLFTSGSEGAPKGVVLSHENILANRYQLAARVDFNSADLAFNALPIFHSFGLTGGFLLPLFSGVKTFLYPSPLHYRIIPEMIYGMNATITFGTDTFLRGYGRAAHPYDLHSLRYVFAGAESVREETRRLWIEKFGIRILEGYGATETSPVISTNTAMQYKAGTVGRVLPGIRIRIEPVEGLRRGGRLFVSGPNVMLGYLRRERQGVLEAPPAEGYDTGDIVEMDEHGYLSVIGRAKRFAKIGGEMISLAAVEDLVLSLWPDSQHAVISIPDAHKGERLVLVTDRTSAKSEDLFGQARKRGVPEFMVPRTVIVMDHIPKLGTGKIDYATLSETLSQRVLESTLIAPGSVAMQ